MKRSIILVLVYFLVQLVASFLCMGVLFMYQYAQTGSFVVTGLAADVAVPSLVLGIVIMAIILWRLGYLRPVNEVWNVLTPEYLGWTALMGISMIFLLDFLLSIFDFLPNWLEESFDLLESDYIGILAVSVLGPILEEMLFRGAITRELLKHYKPMNAILISGLIFGLFHINPAQVLPAMLIGFVLAWLYWRTKSIVPGIVIHIINNSLSCYLSVAYPNKDSLFELIGNAAVSFGVLIAVTLLYVSYEKLRSLPPSP